MRFARPLLGSGMLLAGMLMLGRISGLIRELGLARALGVSHEADIAVVLLTLPDLLVNLLLTGGVSAALVPRFKQLSADEGANLFLQAMIWAGGSFALVGLLLFLYPAAIFGVIAPGLSPLGGGPAVTWVALAIPFTALSGVTAAYLNAQGRYLVAGAGTLIFNLCVIVALSSGASGAYMLMVLGGGIAAGAALRLASQAAILPWTSIGGTRIRGLADRAVFHAFAAGVLAAGLTQMPQIVVRAAASLLGNGVIASFNYAQKLVELPLGILITTISTIALTKLSGLVAEGREEEVRAELVKDLRLALLLAMLVTLFGLCFADPAVHLLFGRGEMDATALDRVAALTRVALLGVPCVAVSSLCVALLNARLQTSTVFRVTLISVLAMPLLIAPGLAMRSTSVLMGAVVAFQALLALWLAKRAEVRLGHREGVFGRAMVRTLAVAGAIATPFLLASRAMGDCSEFLQLGVGGTGFVLALYFSFRMIR